MMNFIAWNLGNVSNKAMFLAIKAGGACLTIFLHLLVEHSSTKNHICSLHIEFNQLHGQLLHIQLFFHETTNWSYLCIWRIGEFDLGALTAWHGWAWMWLCAELVTASVAVRLCVVQTVSRMNQSLSQCFYVFPIHCVWKWKNMKPFSFNLRVTANPTSIKPDIHQHVDGRCSGAVSKIWPEWQWNFGFWWTARVVCKQKNAESQTIMSHALFTFFCRKTQCRFTSLFRFLYHFLSTLILGPFAMM